jgi:signal transduction histidine kinase
MSSLRVIPADRLATLFEPFRREPRHTRSSGLGMGLFISQQIALAHGGDIEVASSPAAATIVTIRLPCAAEAAAESTTRSHSHGAVSGPRALA